MQQHNPNDPMNNSGPARGRELMARFAEVANGFDVDVVVDAATNMVLDAIRKRCATRKEAEIYFDALFGKSKNLLLEQHYDPVTERRRNIFPFTQVVHAELVHFDDNFNQKK